MAMRANALAVLAKAPVAGQVKTRLLPALSAEEAAGLCRALLIDQLEHLQGLAVADLYVAFTPDEAGSLMKQLVPAGFHLFPQQGDDLGERMKRVFEHLGGLGHEQMVLIGSDLPAVPFRFFEDAYAYLQGSGKRVVLGPSRDGGYYLVGLNQPVSELFEAMTWSHGQVLAQTRDKLASLEVDTLLLPSWFDVDTPDDLRYLQSQLNLNVTLSERMKETWALLRRLKLSERRNPAS
jgi:uncharacterized protein